MREISTNKKTATITFRFDQDLIERLHKEAKNHQVSTNTLATQALKRFLEWDIYQPRVGLVSINKPVFIKIFENLKEKEVAEIASTIGKDEVRDVDPLWPRLRRRAVRGSGQGGVRRVPGARGGSPLRRERSAAADRDRHDGSRRVGGDARARAQGRCEQ